MNNPHEKYSSEWYKKDIENRESNIKNYELAIILLKTCNNISLKPSIKLLKISIKRNKEIISNTKRLNYDKKGHSNSLSL